MNELPEPLTSADCDLTDFPYMELDVRRLRDSKFAASSDGEAFRAAILLWCASWHQIPAASLPDDDIELSNLAGFGRVVKEWKKVRAEALNGFVKCSDGRLYHSVIAEKAVAAFAAKEVYAYKKFQDRLRKENASRAKDSKPLFGIPTQEQWKSGAYPHGIPPSANQIPTETTTNSAGIPTENALKGNREGEGTERERERERETNSVTDVTVGAADIPPAALPMDDKDKVFTYGVPILVNAGSTDKAARSFLAGLCKGHGDAAVVQALRDCIRARPVEPLTWLAALLPPKGVAKQANKQIALEERNRAVADEWLRSQETNDATI
jgi:hypothetical protein